MIPQYRVNKTKQHTRVMRDSVETQRLCVDFFYSINDGESFRSRSFFTSQPREYAPTIENRRRTSSPCPPLDNLGGPDSPPYLLRWLYRSPLFPLQSDQQLTPLTTRGKPWWLSDKVCENRTTIQQIGYWGGQDLILITLDRHECFSVFHHLQRDKQRKQRHSLKLGKKRRESSKRNYYIISPRVIIKAIIINTSQYMIQRFFHTSVYQSRSYISVRELRTAHRSLTRVCLRFIYICSYVYMYSYMYGYICIYEDVCIPPIRKIHSLYSSFFMVTLVV